MKYLKLSLLLSACLFLVNCGKGANTANTNTKVSTTTTNTTAATSTTPSPQATPQAAGSPSRTMSAEDKISTPEDAARGLFNAFGRHDRDAAAKFASDAAVAKLFKESTGTEGMKFQGCNDEGGDLNCAYSYEGGALIMHVKGSKEAGYKVQSVQFIAD
ncbi:MAG: hypothetical protein M3362_12800 [Acidobacteriota bacterium]|nr:hypothetical protein [Acidobacteriota bacterium]